MALFTGSVSGQGFSDFEAFSNVIYVIWYATSLGTEPDAFDPLNEDRLSKLGWFSFYHRGDDGEGGFNRYFDDVIYMNFRRGRWHPTPNGGSAIYLPVGSWGVRWSIGVGAVVDLEVG